MNLKKRANRLTEWEFYVKLQPVSLQATLLLRLNLSEPKPLSPGLYFHPKECGQCRF
jgi:hypothetical protein